MRLSHVVTAPFAIYYRELSIPCQSRSAKHLTQ